MNLTEAMNSGKPFRRPSWTGTYHWVENKSDHFYKILENHPGLHLELHKDDGGLETNVGFTPSDVLANDYELVHVSHRFGPLVFDMHGNLVLAARPDTDNHIPAAKMDEFIRWITKSRIARGCALNLGSKVDETAGYKQLVLTGSCIAPESRTPFIARIDETGFRVIQGPARLTLSGAVLLAKFINDYLYSITNNPAGR